MRLLLYDKEMEQMNLHSISFLNAGRCTESIIHLFIPIVVPTYSVSVLHTLFLDRTWDFLKT